MYSKDVDPKLYDVLKKASLLTVSPEQLLLFPFTLQRILTLDNIYKYASDEELEAIVHSIIGRTWEQWKKSGINPNLLKPTDQELHEVAKGLRKPQ